MLVFFNYIGFFTSVLFSMSVFKWCQLWKNNVKKPFCFQFQFLISFNFFTFWFAINHYSIILKGSNKTQQALCKYNETNTSFFPNKYLVNVRQVSNKKRVTSLWVFIQNVTVFLSFCTEVSRNRAIYRSIWNSPLKLESTSSSEKNPLEVYSLNSSCSYFKSLKI